MPVDPSLPVTPKRASRASPTEQVHPHSHLSDGRRGLPKRSLDNESPMVISPDLSYYLSDFVSECEFVYPGNSYVGLIREIQGL